jgi:transcriptional regulator with GAF, ATPase, and Fis domain
MKLEGEILDLENRTSEKLVELALVLAQQNDYEETVRLVAEKIKELFNPQTVWICMINPRTRETVKTICREGIPCEDKQFRSLQIHVCGWMVKNKKSFTTLDIRKDARFRKNFFKSIPLKCVLGVPLRIEGLVIGALMFAKSEGQAQTIESEIGYLERFAAIATPFLRNVHKIHQYFQTPLPESALLTKYEERGLLGRSEKFLQLLRSVEAAARSDVRVMLQGPSGTGKELVAKAIHQFSSRADNAFIALDCGAIPSHLLESELFGSMKGAFTGATTDRKGLLEEADQGTLFMDEITNLPLEMQAKLMRALQEGEIRPLGSNHTRAVDVRIISASSNSLRDLVTQKKFREDLYYRLYVYPIAVPSLNERNEDIPLLSNRFLERFALQQDKLARGFHEELMDYLKARIWRGNIRELENFVERLATLVPEKVEIVTGDILPKEMRKELKKLVMSDDLYLTKSLSERLAEYERKLISEALSESHWNKSQAARVLKMPVQTIRYKINKLGIEKPLAF